MSSSSAPADVRNRRALELASQPIEREFLAGRLTSVSGPLARRRA